MSKCIKILIVVVAACALAKVAVQTGYARTIYVIPTAPVGAP